MKRLSAEQPRGYLACASSLERRASTWSDLILLTASSGSISGRLQAEAREADTQLLVLGAYSHSRLRESIFGGVTDDILTATRIPVLMAH